MSQKLQLGNISVTDDDVNIIAYYLWPTRASNAYCFMLQNSSQQSSTGYPGSGLVPWLSETLNGPPRQQKTSQMRIGQTAVSTLNPHQRRNAPVSALSFRVSRQYG